MVNNSITFIGLDTHKDFFEVANLEDSRDAKPVSKNRAPICVYCRLSPGNHDADKAVYLADGQ